MARVKTTSAYAAETKGARHGPHHKNIAHGAKRKPSPRPGIRSKMGPIKGPKSA